MNDPSKVQLGTRIVGAAFPVAEGGVRYWENTRIGAHSMFASATGAANSTIIPVLGGAVVGGAAGFTFGDGFGAIPGAVAGGVISYKYGDELNAQGITAAEYLQSGQAQEDAARQVLATHDSTGMTLSQYLDRAFTPRSGHGF